MLEPTNQLNQNIYSTNPSYFAANPGIGGVSNEPATTMVKVGLNDVFVTYDDNESEGGDEGLVMGSAGGYNNTEVSESNNDIAAETSMLHATAGIGGSFSATAPPMPPFLGDTAGGLLPESVQNFLTHPPSEIEHFQSTIKGEFSVESLEYPKLSDLWYFTLPLVYEFEVSTPATMNLFKN